MYLGVFFFLFFYGYKFVFISRKFVTKFTLINDQFYASNSSNDRSLFDEFYRNTERRKFDGKFKGNVNAVNFSLAFVWLDYSRKGFGNDSRKWKITVSRAPCSS